MLAITVLSALCVSLALAGVEILDYDPVANPAAGLCVALCVALLAFSVVEAITLPSLSSPLPRVPSPPHLANDLVCVVTVL